MSEEIRVVLRKYNSTTDQPFIFATWRKSAFYLSATPIEENSKVWFQNQTRMIQETLPVAYVRIACLDGDPSTIIGYSIMREKHLEWVYVKTEFRKQGIATLLVPKELESVTPHVTKMGLEIAKKKSLRIQGETP